MAFSLKAGVQISVGDKAIKGFKKIRAELGGRKRVGYVLAADLETQSDLGKHGQWALGGAVFYSRLSQASRSFSTTDEVTYTTDEYVSSSFNVGVFGQYGVKNFWRGYGVLRSVEYNSKAALNVPGASAQQIEVGYRFLGAGLQKAWSLFGDTFYAGLGLEVAKSLSIKAKIGAQDLSDKSKAPDYAGGHVMGGGQYVISNHWSAFGELRLGAVLNQSPTIGVVEVVVSALYWP